MPKKYTVLTDELEIKGGGCYCIMPFEKLDKFGKACFKVGCTTNFYNRNEQYHTAFFMGFWHVAYLKNPRECFRETVKNETIFNYYVRIEKFIFAQLTKMKAQRIYSTTRVKSADEEGKGITEWFYTDLATILKAFNAANAKFGNDDCLNVFTLKDINKNYQMNLKQNPIYHGEIIVPLGKK